MQFIAAALIALATATGQQPVIISAPPAPTNTHDRVGFQQCFDKANPCAAQCFSDRNLALIGGAEHTLPHAEMKSLINCVNDCLKPKKSSFNNKQ